MENTWNIRIMIDLILFLKSPPCTFKEAFLPQKSCKLDSNRCHFYLAKVTNTQKRKSKIVRNDRTKLHDKVLDHHNAIIIWPFTQLLHSTVNFCDWYIIPVMALYFILKSFIVFMHSKIAFIDDYLLVSKAAGIIRHWGSTHLILISSLCLYEMALSCGAAVSGGFVSQKVGIGP